MIASSSDWLELAAPDRVEFARSPLALSLCQIKYAPMLIVSNPVAVAPFQQALLDDFPIISQEQQQNLTIQVQGDPAQQHTSVHSNAGSTVWRFTDTNDNWTLVLTSEFVTLETRSYNHFPEFLDRLAKVLRALIKHIHPRVCFRVGLRYINEIRTDSLDYSVVIRRELLGPLAVPQLGSFASQSVQHHVLNAPDGVTVNLQHGLLPGGSVVAPKPNVLPPSTPFYVLDIDVFREFKPNELPMKVQPILAHVERYHDIVSLLFRWSVTEPYTDTLGRRNNGAG